MGGIEPVMISRLPTHTTAVDESLQLQHQGVWPKPNQWAALIYARGGGGHRNINKQVTLI